MRETVQEGVEFATLAAGMIEVEMGEEQHQPEFQVCDAALARH